LIVRNLEVISDINQPNPVLEFQVADGKKINDCIFKSQPRFDIFLSMSYFKYIPGQTKDMARKESGSLLSQG